jgi:hypothetical protein
MYSGTGNLVLIASPLSEIAYQMADNATGSLSDFAKVIEEKRPYKLNNIKSLLLTV